MPRRPGQYAFTSIFRKLTPDLSEPDGEGWASGTCPYCHAPGSFRANLSTGAWVCMPIPEPAVDRGKVGGRSGRGAIASHLESQRAG